MAIKGAMMEMTPLSDRAVRRRGFGLLCVAAAAALTALYLANSSPGGALPVDEHVSLDTAPTAPPTQPVEALDAGVDWSRVEAAGDPGPLAVAAYGN
jgi:hypothetical protein